MLQSYVHSREGLEVCLALRRVQRWIGHVWVSLQVWVLASAGFLTKIQRNPRERRTAGHSEKQNEVAHSLDDEVAPWGLTIKLSHKNEADKGKVIPKGNRMGLRPA